MEYPLKTSVLRSLPLSRYRHSQHHVSTSPDSQVPVLVYLLLPAQLAPRVRRYLPLLQQYGNTQASSSQSRSSTLLQIRSKTISSHGVRLSAQCWHTIFRLLLGLLLPSQQSSAGQLQPQILGATSNEMTQWQRMRTLWRGG
jgi:hypothetical protein